ncbi:glycoside hydrolase family 25 protein [Dysgonomonas macrotermitis]|uniref:Lysozyme n=1 Tax=Dysgonomonas macrotermitis TaxID=1346286 RepID=A0A1M5DVA2_9BACT|nr:GH25 family lysozyme [Dysgonomonas macrotermitis]SHF70850.1 lysozyme [Dysgonomonas macrotermitis]
MPRKYIVLFAVILIAVVTLYKLLESGYLRFNYPSFDKYPIHGIDISHHQKTINWDTLFEKESKYVQFVFIKATEGATHRDSKFEDNWNNAKKRRLLVGAYHFFSFCSKGSEQAANYIEVVPLDSLALPPVVDLEFGGNCKEENRMPDLFNEIVEFISIIEKHYKKKAIIYATQEFYDLYLKNELTTNPIWIRDIYKNPELEEGREWAFWQYANRGRLEGIDTFVDINVFNGTHTDLERLRKERIHEDSVD